MKKREAPLVLRIDPDLRRDLEARAAKEGLTVSDIARDLIREGLGRHIADTPRDQLRIASGPNWKEELEGRSRATLQPIPPVSLFSGSPPRSQLT